MRRVRGWWGLLGCVMALVGFNQCTLRWNDMRGFPCDNDVQCGPSLRCLSDICGGPIAESITDASPPEVRVEDAGGDSGPTDRSEPPEGRDEGPHDDCPKRPDGALPESSPELQPFEPALCKEAPANPDAPPSLSTHAKWVQAAGGEYNTVFQRSVVLPVGKDAIYLVGAYRRFQGVTPAGSIPPQTYGLIAKFNTAGVLQWTTAITGDTPDVRVHDIAAAPDGTLVVTGMFYGTANFGTLVRKARKNGEGDVFAAKYDPNKRVWVWASTWGSPTYDEGWKVLVNQMGEVFVSGTIKGHDHTFTTEGKTTQVMHNSWGMPRSSPNGYLVKMTSKGRYVWHKLFGSTQGYGRAFVYPDIFSPSHLYVLFSYEGVLLDKQNREVLRGSGLVNTALMRIESCSGKATQVLSLGGKDKVNMIHFTQEPKSGDFILAGGFSGTWAYKDPKGKAVSITAGAPIDSVLLRLSKAGKVQWLRRFGGREASRIEQIVLAPDGAIFGVGGFRDNFILEWVELQSPGRKTDTNGFIAKFSSCDGHVLGAWILQGPFCQLHSIKAGPNGLYLSGNFKGEVKFGAKTTSPVHAVGGSDNFLLHFVP